MPETTVATKPRLAFIGTGWIGLNRMEAVAESGFGEVAAICDSNPEMLEKAQKKAGEAKVIHSLEEAISEPAIDALVIATPSGLHAEQSVEALKAGKAVFCQKPLGRNADETRYVVETAKKMNKLLKADHSYRYVDGVADMRKRIQKGEIGQVYGVNLVFHNAYGPDKEWFYDASRSGGGCLIDLGVHLADMALWVLNFPYLKDTASSLYHQGQLLMPSAEQKVEDYATALVQLDNTVSLNLACSWNLPAGQEAVIEATFYGTQGGLSFKNINGSFYDFQILKYNGTQTEVLHEPSADWGGNAAVAFAEQLSRSSDFDPAAEEYIEVAAMLDKIYGR